MVGVPRFLLVALTACTAPFDPSLLTDAKADVNLVFVTSSTQQGNFGGLAGADAICANDATNAGLPGTYVAWLSTDTFDIRTRIGEAKGWARVDGKGVANDLTELATSGPRVPISRTANNADLRAVTAHVYTGTQPNGQPGMYDCGNWTLNNVGDVLTGDIAGGRDTFTETDRSACSLEARLYCFGVDKSTPLPPPPVGEPLAFLSRMPWTPTTGIAGADTICTDEASAASLPGTFKAALPTVGTKSADRFRTRPVYYLPGGGELGRILEMTSAESFFTRYADGTPAPNIMAWTGGAPSSIADDAATCMNWTSSTAMGIVGQPHFADKRIFVRYAREPCANPRAVYCLQDL